ncbi:eIF4E-binding protein [Acrasis kona]|uniref:EIF4E-binding protein n=1 Tax=Acrasis kona TaxID=1008807 RepID=A0AAW2ZLM9_9EUKA
MSQSSSISIPVGNRLGVPVELTDISQTPGGTIYGTTPGGTRRVYNRNVLMTIRNSPHSKTPPVNLPSIPGVTKGAGAAPKPIKTKTLDNNHGDDDLFHMDE